MKTVDRMDILQLESDELEFIMAEKRHKAALKRRRTQLEHEEHRHNNKKERHIDVNADAQYESYLRYGFVEDDYSYCV